MTGTLRAGCKAARVSPHTVYQWREHDEAFVILENQARHELADQLEEEAIRRAWRGTLKPVFNQGAMVGHVREYSDTLLIFMLKAVRPDKFRDRLQLQHADADGQKFPLGAIRQALGISLADED